jgi:hypothetical protein
MLPLPLIPLSFCHCEAFFYCHCEERSDVAIHSCLIYQA